MVISFALNLILHYFVVIILKILVIGLNDKDSLYPAI